MDFETMTKRAIAGSPELTEDDVASALCNDARALYPYGYRVAALVARYVKRSAISVDDEDWQDCIQECMAQFPSIINGYDPSKGKLFKYLAGAYINIMRSYLKRSANGGMGSARSGATFTVSYDDIAYRAEGDVSEEILSYGDGERFGMRDPYIETEAHDRVKQAMIFAAHHGLPRGPNMEGKPISKSAAKRLNASRDPALDF
jgi:hypothetical protein